MQSINFNSDWYKLDPLACIWTMSGPEYDKALEYWKYQCSTRLGFVTQNIVTVAQTVDTWIANQKADPNYAFKSAEAYRIAFEKVVNDAVAGYLRTYSYQAASEKFTAPKPTVQMSAVDTFYGSPFFDAYFNAPADALKDPALRLFVSTPYFKGPGTYQIFTQDRRVVTVAVDKRPTNDVFFHVTAKHSGKGLNVSGGSTAAGAPVVQWPTSSVSHDNWRVEPTSDGHHLICTQHSVQTLNVPDNSTADGVQMVQWPWGGGAANEVWRFDYVGNGYFHIVSKLSGKLLGVKDGSTADGAPVVQMPDTGADHHKWKLSPI